MDSAIVGRANNTRMGTILIFDSVESRDAYRKYVNEGEDHGESYLTTYVPEPGTYAWLRI